MNEQRIPIPHGYWRRSGAACTATDLDTPDDPCVLQPASFTGKWQASVDKIVLFHYGTKSLEDFHAKQARGGGTRPSGRPISFFRHWNKCASNCSRAETIDRDTCDVQICLLVDAFTSE